MRHLVKNENSEPSILKEQGASETQKNIREFTESRSKGQMKTDFKIKSSIYGDITVKDALLKLQANTCCYCESKFRDNSFGDIEHYRPKSEYKQSGDDNVHKPAYFWLAYDWNNLLVSCEVCNRVYKKTYFPLKNPEVRDDSIKSLDTQNEKPLILNPYETEHPEEHLGFYKGIEYPISDEGYATWLYCGLFRQELEEERGELYQHFKDLEYFVKKALSKEDREKALNILKTRLKESIESGRYTLMLKCNFGEYLSEDKVTSQEE